MVFIMIWFLGLLLIMAHNYFFVTKMKKKISNIWFKLFIVLILCAVEYYFFIHIVLGLTFNLVPNALYLHDEGIIGIAIVVFYFSVPLIAVPAFLMAFSSKK